MRFLAPPFASNMPNLIKFQFPFCNTSIRTRTFALYDILWTCISKINFFNAFYSIFRYGSKTDEQNFASRNVWHNKKSQIAIHHQMAMAAYQHM